MQKIREYYTSLINTIGRRRGSYVLKNEFLSRFPHVDIKTTLEGEEEFKFKWEGFPLHPNPLYYRAYSRISGLKNINYVPDNIYRKVILGILNENRLHRAYSDKNSYNKLLRLEDKNMPYIFIRNMNGSYYDNFYKPLELNDASLHSIIQNEKKIIIKPSIESGGGKNIELFKKTNSGYENEKKIKLNLYYLKDKFHKNFLIQKYIEQHSYLRQFNPSSLNTIRVFTYRSVTDHKIHILGTFLRFGNPGSLVDNINAGGFTLKIHGDGSPDKVAYTKNAIATDCPNGIILSNLENFPMSNNLLELAIKVASQNQYQRFLGLDITLDIENNYKLIEINTDQIGITTFQASGTPIFGEFTDEIINYCRSRLNQ